MTDGKLAVIGLGTIGSMSLWQASRLTDSAVGFEAQMPAHGRSAVGGDTRLFRRLHLNPGFDPLLQESQRLWAELEAETGQDILLRCGGIYIGTENGDYIPRLLASARATGSSHEVLSRDEMAKRYPQHNLRPDDIGVYDPNGGAIRTERAVTAAIAAAQGNGATVHTNTIIDDIRETQAGVVVSSADRSWTFENVIVASGGWSRKLLPEPLLAQTQLNRVFLTWFVAKNPALFSPDRFPIFVHNSGDRSLYGAPAVDGATVKATLDMRPTPTDRPDAIARELTPAEIAETMDTVGEFFPDLYPNIVRSDAFPELFTRDRNPILGKINPTTRVYYATGFSGGGFKMATAYGKIAAHEALGKEDYDNLDFLRPQRFITN